MLLTFALPTLGVGTQRWDETLLLPDVQGLNVPRPILNMGLPRSATTSVLAVSEERRCTRSRTLCCRSSQMTPKIFQANGGTGYMKGLPEG